MSEQNRNLPSPGWDTLAKCYREDADFRGRMAADPAAAMAETGLELPAGFDRVSVVENTADTFHVVFPPNPNALLGDETLGAVSGGTCYGGGGGSDDNTPMSDYYMRNSGSYWS